MVDQNEKTQTFESNTAETAVPVHKTPDLKGQKNSVEVIPMEGKTKLVVTGISTPENDGAKDQQVVNKTPDQMPKEDKLKSSTTKNSEQSSMMSNTTDGETSTVTSGGGKTKNSRKKRPAGFPTKRSVRIAKQNADNQEQKPKSGKNKLEPASKKQKVDQSEQKQTVTPKQKPLLGKPPHRRNSMNS
jgi:hypothetical protein